MSPLNAGCAALLLVTAMVGPVHGQSLSFGDGANGPIEIHADNGIEWQQSDSRIQARGNARAVNGDVQVRADVLSAYYRETEDGGTEIWRLDAEGDVAITSPTEAAYGDRGVYDVDNAILVLSGDDTVRLIAEGGEITAEEQLEYWQRRQLAVARGNAVAVREDKTLRADVLAAYFSADSEGRSRIQRVEAFEGVEVTTAEEVVRADRAVYDVDRGVATLIGTVRISRGDNQLNGCEAEVDLESGVSKLRSCSNNDDGDNRVRGLIQPEAVGRQ